MNFTTNFFRAGVRVMIDEEGQRLVTRFEDGTTVPATANHDAESIARAHHLGYDGDTWAMSRDHEMAHTILAFGISPTMWRLAHPGAPGVASDELVAHEEAAVLAYQRYMNTRRREGL